MLCNISLFQQILKSSDKMSFVLKMYCEISLFPPFFKSSDKLNFVFLTHIRISVCIYHAAPIHSFSFVVANPPSLGGFYVCQIFLPISMHKHKPCRIYKYIYIYRYIDVAVNTMPTSSSWSRCGPELALS